MAFALRHRESFKAQSHLHCDHRLGRYLAGLSWRARLRLAPGPPLNFKVHRLAAAGGCWRFLFPYNRVVALVRPLAVTAPKAHTVTTVKVLVEG